MRMRIQNQCHFQTTFKCVKDENSRISTQSWDRWEEKYKSYCDHTKFEEKREFLWSRRRCYSNRYVISIQIFHRQSSLTFNKSNFNSNFYNRTFKTFWYQIYYWKYLQRQEDYFQNDVESLHIYTNFLKILHHRDWFVKIKLRKRTQKIKRMFFVDKNVIKIFNQNSKILILNCTYKINWYKMSLMIIANQIDLKIIFFIEFDFISNEKKNNYIWIIEQIKNLYKNFDLKNFEIVIIDRDETFVNVLNVSYFEICKFFCIWHINKNVIKNCKFSFDKTKNWKKFYNMWHDVVNAFITKTCMKIWSIFCDKYDSFFWFESFYIWFSSRWRQIFSRHLNWVLNSSFLQIRFQSNFIFWYHHYISRWEYASNFQTLFEVFHRRFAERDWKNRNDVDESIQELFC